MVLYIVILTVSTFCAPVYTLFTGIISTFIIYVRIYANKTSHHYTYMIVGYGLMMSIVFYTLICLTMTFLHMWGVVTIRTELLLSTPLFISILILAPVTFFTLIYVYIRRDYIHRKLDSWFGIHNDRFLKGKLGALLSHESRIQIRNLILIFGVIAIVNWAYYSFIFYKDGMLNKKDIFIFFWVNIAALAFYLLYLLIHNYNLDLDLKESGQLITPEEAGNMSPKTYLRYYVLCGNRMYINYECEDPENTAHKVLDTPYYFSRLGRGITEAEVKRMISDATGVDDGELRFFFGFQTPGLKAHSVLRYFYFLNGNPSDYPQLDHEDGEWVTFDELKYINKKRPHGLSSYLKADAVRLLTIIRTEKLYDENGMRRYKIKSYVPSFRLSDVRTTDIDFQSNHWIDISMHNSDNKFFRLRRFLRRFTGSSRNSNTIML